MKLLLPFIYFTLISFSSFAQGEANRQINVSAKNKLTGIVKDSTTASAIPGATIELTNTAAINSSDYFKRSVIADFNGQFTLNNIPSSQKYILTVTAIGYKTISKNIWT